MMTHVAGSWGSWTRPRISDSAELERGDSCLVHPAPESRDWVTLSSGVKWGKLGMAEEVTGRDKEAGADTPNSEDRKSCSTLVAVTSGSSFRQSFELGGSLSRG